MLSDVTFTIEQCERIYFFLFFLFNFLSIYLSKSDTRKGLIRYNCCIVNIKSQKIVIIPTRKIIRQCKNLLSKVELIISFHSILRFFFSSSKYQTDIPKHLSPKFLPLVRRFHTTKHHIWKHIRASIWQSIYIYI